MTTHLEDLTTEAERDGVQQLVVGAVVEHDGRILLLRRPGDDFMGGIWELPSGKVEPGENLDQALSREVEEETGLHVTGIGRYIDSFDYRSGSGKHSRQFNFTVQCAAPRTRPAHRTRRLHLDPTHRRTPRHRRRQTDPHHLPEHQLNARSSWTRAAPDEH